MKHQVGPTDLLQTDIAPQVPLQTAGRRELHEAVCLGGLFDRGLPPALHRGPGTQDAKLLGVYGEEAMLILPVRLREDLEHRGGPRPRQAGDEASSPLHHEQREQSRQPRCLPASHRARHQTLDPARWRSLPVRLGCRCGIRHRRGRVHRGRATNRPMGAAVADLLRAARSSVHVKSKRLRHREDDVPGLDASPSEPQAEAVAKVDDVDACASACRSEVCERDEVLAEELLVHRPLRLTRR
mmetsp:Transcript_72432/g.187947  ORF Transcript_72432/g.187947 Transcript_72432/m.187947 type:complete len:241 (-) Transcript_72432:215-937(-)